jgi:glycerol-3-phosphate dehydrogenase
VCRNEVVCTLENLLARRAGFLYWDSEQRLERARDEARVIRAELDLAEKEFKYQLASYREHLTRFHTLPDSVP